MAFRIRRTPGAELSSEQRAAIYSLSKASVSLSKLANDFTCNRKTIVATIKRFKTYQTFDSLPQNGRPKLLSVRGTNHLIILAHRHPFWTYKQLSATLAKNLSRSIIIRILAKVSLLKRLSKKKILISKLLARKRTRFARR